MLYSKQSYTSYKKFSKKFPKSDRIIGRDNVGKLHKVFWEIVGEMLVESTGGVYLKGVGYFFILKTVKKAKHNLSMFKTTDFITFNLHTDGYMFNPSFLPYKNSPFGFWSIDSSFSHGIRKELSKKLRSGYLYKMHAQSLSNFLKIDNEQNRRNYSANT